MALNQPNSIKTNSIASSFQTNSSSPRDLLALKLSKVKATAALFESRSSQALLSSDGIRPPSADPVKLPSYNPLTITTTPPSSSQSYPSLKLLSSGHVNQIKNQFLSNHSLVDLQRRHSQPNKVLDHYHPDHLNRLSQSIRSNNNNNNTSSSQSSSSLIHKLSNLSLQQPQLTSTDQQINSSDSNSTSTTTSQHHEPTHPITSSDTNSDHNNNNNLFSEQEPTQSQPSQDTLNDITTLALSARITEIAMSIQEVALALFQVQELRHSSASSSSSNHHHHQANSNRQSAASQTSPSILAADRPSGSDLTQVDKALMRLEKKVETTTLEMVELETLISSYRNQHGSSASAQSRLVNDKFDNILQEWEQIQHDTEILKDELKEDKWLVVFRAVSGQAEEMMESLEKVLTVSQEFIRETHRRTRTRHNSPSELNQSSKSHVVVRKNRDSHASSISSNHDRQESEELMKYYNSLIKNFDAKNKHYVPSCERVLGILSKGIKSRSTKNGEVLRRYADMNLRFTNIQETINKVGLDLLAVETILQQQTGLVAPSDSIPADSSIQSSEQSFLQPPIDSSKIPTTPTSTSSSKTRKALTSMSNYLISTSPQFLSKHSSSGISNSISPFRKFASKFTSATPSVSSQPSSVCSVSTPSFSILAVNANPNNNTHNRMSQQRNLRPIRSTLSFRPSPSSSSSVSQMMMSSKPGKMTTTPSHSSVLEDNNNSNVRTPSTLLDSQRTRPVSQQIHHQHTLSNEKPRWNISLKRIEDSPVSGSGKLSSSRRVGNQNLTRSQSRAAVRNSSQHRLSQTGGGGMNGFSERPASAAGRSEASCGTTLSMSAYRSRPPSRHSRIPAPLWDPNMESQRRQSKGSLDLADLVRPHSRTGANHNSSHAAGQQQQRGRPATALSTHSMGLLSPTESDVAKMPGRPPTTLGVSRRTEQVLSQSSLQMMMMSSSTSSTSRMANHHHNLSYPLGEEEEEESDEVNPADPLDMLIHAKCDAQLTKVIIRRLDSPLSRNPEKARLAGAGIGDQARYAFSFLGINKPAHEKSVMCKLVEAKRTSSKGLLSNNSTSESPNNNPLLKVLVRTKAGWKDLDLYLLDCQQPSSSL